MPRDSRLKDGRESDGYTIDCKDNNDDNTGDDDDDDAFWLSFAARTATKSKQGTKSKIKPKSNI